MIHIHECVHTATMYVKCEYFIQTNRDLGVYLSTPPWFFCKRWTSTIQAQNLTYVSAFHLLETSEDSEQKLPEHVQGNSASEQAHHPEHQL
jgi:hypothetical protein